MAIRPGALLDEISLIGVTQTGEEDRYGNPTDETAPAVTVRASVSPVDATEDELGRDTRVTTYRVLCEPTVNVDGLDRIEWNESSYEVIGEPMVHQTRSGPHHLELTITNIKG